MTDFKIIPSLKEEWKTEVSRNACDPYSFGVVVATTRVFEALDQGATPEQAEKGMLGLGISGFMAGCVAGWVGKYHERGNEFRTYWNDKWGVDEEKAKGGMVNPAILTLKR